MKIMRQGKNIVVVQGQMVVKECASFDEARSFLAQNGNEDAAKPIVKHSLTVRGERTQEPQFRGEYALVLGR